MLLSARAAIGGIELTTTTAGSEQSTAPHLYSVVIRPHRSMSPRALVAVVICFAVLSLTIALSFFSMGLWLVLPFAGLEILAVGVVIGLSIRAGNNYESIVVDETQVSVTIYQGGHKKEYRFQRYWARVRLAPQTSRLRTRRLWLGSHGKFVELGRDMTELAREQLAVQLKKAIRHGL